jgi:hypothetical protein
MYGRIGSLGHWLIFSGRAEVTQGAYATTRLGFLANMFAEHDDERVIFVEKFFVARQVLHKERLQFRVRRVRA